MVKYEIRRKRRLLNDVFIAEKMQKNVLILRKTIKAYDLNKIKVILARFQL